MYLTNYVQDIIDGCVIGGLGRYATIGGQEFDTDPYNVVVGNSEQSWCTWPFDGTPGTDCSSLHEPIDV